MQRGATKWRVLCTFDEECSYECSGDLVNYFKTIKHEQESFIPDDFGEARKRLKTDAGYQSNPRDHSHLRLRRHIEPTNITVNLRIRDELLNPYLQLVKEFILERAREVK